MVSAETSKIKEHVDFIDFGDGKSEQLLDLADPITPALGLTLISEEKKMSAEAFQAAMDLSEPSQSPANVCH